MESIIYVGVDVHKATNSVCMFDREHNRYLGEAARMEAGAQFLMKFLRKARRDFALAPSVRFLVGYEAGPTGFGLCRAMNKEQGCTCVIMAPTTIARASGQKVKTDRRDAMLLAVTLANGTYRKVVLPDGEDEAAKEYTRMRNTLARHLKKAKQNLLSFLLRAGCSYPFPGSYWTGKFRQWLKSIRFGNGLLQLAFEQYLQETEDLRAKLELIDARIEELADSERYREKVGRLVCFTGIQTHLALSFCCEVGDFSRFPDARRFASFLGICPGQESSGQKVRYNTITKCGNTRLRLLLVEAAKGIKRSSPYGKSKRILARQQGQCPSVIAYADRGSRRVRGKIAQLEKKGKNCNVATVAGARELACFIWGMMTDNIG
jgi:transposase